MSKRIKHYIKLNAKGVFEDLSPCGARVSRPSGSDIKIAFSSRVVLAVTCKKCLKSIEKEADNA